jgi:MoaA/NifB/PqqE/SkfB family radical SAM enzyme
VAAFLEAFHQTVTERRVPLSGGVELTRRCGLRCRHCYLGEERTRPGDGAALPTARALALLDEIAAAGCLHLFFTGGDPLLHPGFAAIWRHARERGIVAGLFTNALDLGAAALDALREMPPQFVEVSIYGATAPTHEAVTGVAGSFARCLAGVEELARRGLPVELKTVLMKPNLHELAGMEELARARGLRFRFDASIFPRWDGDRAPLALRLDAGEAVAAEFADPRREREWRALHERTRGGASTDRLYVCSAGTVCFHVDADATLRPCLMSRARGLPLRGGDFAASWAQLAERTASSPAAGLGGCSRCEARYLCGYCPGHFGLEAGAEDRTVPFLCDLGRLRLQAVESTFSP